MPLQVFTKVLRTINWHMQKQKNISRIIQISIAFLLMVVLGLGKFIYSEIESLNHHMTDVIKVSNQKSELAFTMRDAIRMRAISLRNMLAMQDIFDRDVESLRFHSYATDYAVAREKMLGLARTEEENAILKRLDHAIKTAKPLNLAASDYLISDFTDKSTGQKIIDSAFDAQQVALKILDELVFIQKEYSNSTLRLLHDRHHETSELLLAVGLLVTFGSFFILVFVGKLVTNRNEALQQATETKSRFLANMSHEIRTPLTAIIGYSRLLRDNRLEASKTNDAIATVVKNSEHLMHLINDILDFSKIEANRLEIEKNETSLFELIEDVVKLMKDSVERKGLVFRNNYNYPLPDLISTDAVRLKQILVNLIGNAVKFTEDGSVTLNVSYITDKNRLLFEVKDTGIGLSEPQQEKIFEEFSQAESSTTRKFGGTGLGLSISSQLATLLGGELKVKSKPDKGSCFYFNIDPGNVERHALCRERPAFNKHISNIVDRIDQFKVTGNILLVDDTEDNRALISTYLSDFGADVITANNGQEAVDLVKNKNFDLILMDMQMPVMGGLEALTEMRRLNYQNPIVMLTANALKEEKDMCIEAGSNDFLVKPIEMVELSRVLCSYLQTVDNIENKSNTSAIEINSAYCAIDEDKIFSSMMGKSDKIDQLITAFIGQIPEYINNIENSWRENNLEKLRYHVHRLKGVGGNYGYTDITNICKKLEIALIENNTNDFEKGVKLLNHTNELIQAGSNTIPGNNSKTSKL